MGGQVLHLLREINLDGVCGYRTGLRSVATACGGQDLRYARMFGFLVEPRGRGVTHYQSEQSCPHQSWNNPVEVAAEVAEVAGAHLAASGMQHAWGMARTTVHAVECGVSVETSLCRRTRLATAVCLELSTRDDGETSVSDAPLSDTLSTVYQSNTSGRVICVGSSQAANLAPSSASPMTPSARRLASAGLSPSSCAGSATCSG